jgi:hypothetical protein
MFGRIVRVFRLDLNTFEEIEHDEAATGQAAIIVASVALLSALSNGFLASRGEGRFLTSFFLVTLVWTFVSWFLWAALANFIGTAFFGGKATVNEMLRGIGFAYAPQILIILPCLGGVVGAIWSLIAGFIAVRQGLELDNLKAALTILIGFVVYIVGSLLLGFLFGRAFPFGGL